MKNVTITMDERLLAKARVEAAKQGKSLSRYVSDIVIQRIGQPLSQEEAMDRFLAGPLMSLTDEEGRAPSRDRLYDRDR